ncbi:hypothetical protein BDW_02745 [Bdellovibrio bacteriovorus W]|nr:hypothetical protein BDW_02745 [Bdellovibrio bacteriovorus W]
MLGIETEGNSSSVGTASCFAAIRLRLATAERILLGRGLFWKTFPLPHSLRGF